MSPDCRKNSDCTDASKPLCDTVTGECFNGCRTNADCKAGVEFCLMHTILQCTQKPEKGQCSLIEKTTVGIYTVSTYGLDYWSAQNFCEALDMHLVDISTKCSNWAEIKSGETEICLGLGIGLGDFEWGPFAEYQTNTKFNSCLTFYALPAFDEETGEIASDISGIRTNPQSSGDGLALCE